MENKTDAAKVAALDDFDLSDIDSADEAKMTVVANGKLTSWVWTFAGPGHPKAIEQSNRLARERLHHDRMIENARANGKKYKAPEESVDEVREKNVRMVVERLLGWSPVKMNGQDFPFSPESAKNILLDPRKQSLLIQALEFIGEETAFTQRSEKDSKSSPSASSN